MVGENVVCELRAHANLRNKTASRGIRGYERKHPGTETSVQILYWLECATRKAKNQCISSYNRKDTHKLMALRNEVTINEHLLLLFFFGRPPIGSLNWKMLQEANAHPELTGLVPAKGGG